MKVYQTVWSLLLFLGLTSDDNGCMIAWTIKGKKCYHVIYVHSSIAEFSANRISCLYNIAIVFFRLFARELHALIRNRAMA